MAEIFVDTKQVKSLAVELAEFPKKVPKEVLVPALNDSLKRVNTAVKRGVSGRYVIPQKEIEKSIKHIHASASNPSASVVLRGKPKGLIHFKLKPSKIQSQQGKKLKARKSLSVMIKKGAGYKQIKIKPSAFVAGANGTPNVFHRQGKKSLPIERLVTLSIPEMLSAKAVIKPVQQRTEEILKERINHHLHRKLKVKGGKK